MPRRVSRQRPSAKLAPMAKQRPDPTRADLRELTILAIDHGEKRIGLAIKPGGQIVVLPLDVVAAEPLPMALDTLRTVIEQRSVRIVVIGLPLDERPEQARKVKRFARKLRMGVTGVKWRFVDESLTTFEAREDGRSPGRRNARKPVDDRAAALILETFLQSASEP